jgi:hypothetical protein
MHRRSIRRPALSIDSYKECARKFAKVTAPFGDLNHVGRIPLRFGGSAAGSLGLRRIACRGFAAVSASAP